MTGWTRGQYSLLRMLLGFSFFCYWASLLFSFSILSEQQTNFSSAFFPNILQPCVQHDFYILFFCSAIACSILLAVGYFDRIAAAILWYLVVCLGEYSLLYLSSTLSVMCWLLIAHLCTPKNRYSLFDSRGLTQNEKAWRLPKAIYWTHWTLLYLLYCYSVYCIGYEFVFTSEGHSLLQYFLYTSQILFLVGVFFAPWRRNLWCVLLLLNILSLFFGGQWQTYYGAILLHLFAFNPSWISPSQTMTGQKQIIFYDGICGLCHAFVCFVLTEDQRSDPFYFMPQQKCTRSHLQLDSVVVYNAKQQELIYSNAVLYILSCLGGYWRVISWLARGIPKKIRDVFYCSIAKRRKKYFATVHSLCPIAPADMQERFL